MNHLGKGSKIQQHHQDLLAIIYIRQSSLHQVEKNIAGAARQYDMRQIALNLGWLDENIIVVDQDRGITGTTIEGRDGFKWMCDEVEAGRVGAIFCLESSRLARDGEDFLHLVKLCNKSDTLIIDEKSVQDPNNDNDHLLLSLMAIISEAEGRALKRKLHKAQRKKAEMGQLRLRIPIGFIHDGLGRAIIDPDEKVQQAVRLVFDLFRQLGSIGKVVKYFANHGLHFPKRIISGARKGELEWKPLYMDRLASILHNPAYAGAYAYGRTKVPTKKALKGRTGKKGQLRVRREEWILIRDAHLGYISWDQYLQNQEQLNNNAYNYNIGRQGATRNGGALLQGIIRCGKCGRNMSVQYPGSGKHPYYSCTYARKLGKEVCQPASRGSAINDAVADLFLKCVEPANLEMSLSVLERIESKEREAESQWNLRLEQTQYEANWLQQHLLQNDPANVLVTRNLRRMLNEKLEELERLEQEQEHQPSPLLAPVDEAGREAIMRLARDLPLVWHSPTTTHAERKYLLRQLIKDVTVVKDGATVHVAVRWQTDACHEFDVQLSRVYVNGFYTNPEVVDLVRQLALTHTDQEIAHELNKRGLTTRARLPFTVLRVRSVRSVHNIPLKFSARLGDPSTGQRRDGRYSIGAAAATLNVSRSTIWKWCAEKKLDHVYSDEGRTVWISLPPEVIDRLKKPASQRSITSDQRDSLASAESEAGSIAA